jgi:hypothetical protein
VPLEECEQRWRDWEGIDHNDVYLPAGWHLNRARMSVPQLTAEVNHRIRNHSEALRCDRKYLDHRQARLVQFFLCTDPSSGCKHLKPYLLVGRNRVLRRGRSDSID